MPYSNPENHRFVKHVVRNCDIRRILDVYEVHVEETRTFLAEFTK